MFYIYSGPHCVAKFEYNNDNPDDLKFAEGATIHLTARVGDEWYKGETGGRSGIFPAAFVDIIEDLPPAGASLGRLTPTTGGYLYEQEKKFIEILKTLFKDNLQYLKNNNNAQKLL